MKKKNVTKIILSKFFRILAIITIIVMGIFIYKLNNDKTAEIQKSAEFQSQVNSLNGTVSDLQGKINNISETINSNKSNEKTSTVDSDGNKANVKDYGVKESVESTIIDNNNNKNNSDDVTYSKKSNTDINKNTSVEALDVYSSGDNAAATGNSELLYVYESSNNTMKFKYYTPWNNEDIEGIAKSSDGEKYIYENGNKKLEILLNSMGENSVKVTEYENNSMTSYKNLFK